MYAYAVVYEPNKWTITFNRKLACKIAKLYDGEVYRKRLAHENEIVGWDAPTWIATSEKITA